MCNSKEWSEMAKPFAEYMIEKVLRLNKENIIQKVDNDMIFYDLDVMINQEQQLGLDDVLPPACVDEQFWTKHIVLKYKLPEVLEQVVEHVLWSALPEKCFMYIVLPQKGC